MSAGNKTVRMCAYEYARMTSCKTLGHTGSAKDTVTLTMSDGRYERRREQEVTER